MTDSTLLPSAGPQTPSRLRVARLVALVVTVAALALLASASWLGNSAVASQKAPRGFNATLQIAGTTYEFKPSTCTVSDTDFVAAGSGWIDGETFWVSASGTTLSLTVGTDSELGRPADDKVWLTSASGIDWAAQDGELWARSSLRDARHADSEPVFGELFLECRQA